MCVCERDKARDWVCLGQIREKPPTRQSCSLWAPVGSYVAPSNVTCMSMEKGVSIYQLQLILALSNNILHDNERPLKKRRRKKEEEESYGSMNVCMCSAWVIEDTMLCHVFLHLGVLFSIVKMPSLPNERSHFCGWQWKWVHGELFALF